MAVSRRRRILAGTAAGLALLAVAAYFLNSALAPRRPNILFVSIDALRADRVGAYGATNGATPEFDRLAARSFLFPNAYAPRAETSPSLASVFTGLYPSRHGVADNEFLLRESIETLPEILGKAGYDTAAFVANNVVRPSRLCRGFAAVRFTALLDRDDGDDDEEATAAACAFLAEERRRPFFAWVHLMNPHVPYDPGPADRGRFTPASLAIDTSREGLSELTTSELPLAAEERRAIAGRYDEEVAGSDRRLGRILAEIEARGLAETTIVVCFSDHGEELGDHHKYFFHSASVYRPALRVPLAIRIPGKGAPAPRPLSGVPVSLVDIAPTIAAFARVRFSHDPDGVDLGPFLRGGSLGRDAVFTEYADKIHGIFTERHHSIDNPEGFAPVGAPFRFGALPAFTVARRELYDLAIDPLEQRNCAAENEEICAALEARIRAFVGGRAARRVQPLAIDGAAAIDDIRRLGYVK